MLVSTSGATTGFAGARAWAREAADAQGASPVDAVIVLGDMAGKRIRKPWVVPWTTDGDAAPLALQRTVESALRAEVAPNPGGARASGQWIRRALPLTLSAQGVVADDRPARGRCSAARASSRRGPTRRSRARAAGLVRRAACCARSPRSTRPGRSTRSARPRSPAFSRGPDGIVTMRNVLPDWAVRLLIGTLLLPALLAALDGFFRARRRHLAVGRWAGWIAAGAVAPLLGWLWLRAARPDRRARPSRPRPWSRTSTRSSTAGIVALVSTRGRRRRRLVRRAAADRVAARRRAATRRPAGSAAATGLVVNVRRRGRVAGQPLRGGAAAAGGAPVAVRRRARLAPARAVGGAARRARRRAAAAGARPLRARRSTSTRSSFAWLVALATADGHISVGAALAVSLWLGCLAGLLVVLRVRRKVEAAAEPERLRTRGPAGYAGPGSLGGTESALRR